MLSRLFNQLRCPDDFPQVDDVLTCEQMRKALLRQRLVADRTGRGFAWVVFQCRDRNDLGRLAGHLRRRLRATDELGVAPVDAAGPQAARRSKFRLLALLPETAPEGATRFADAVASLYAPGSAPPASVHVYRHDAASPLASHAEPIYPAPSVMPRPVLAASFAAKLPWWKRGLDVAAASVGMFIVLPLLAIIALGIRLDSRGPAIFWQARTGRGGRTFHIAKFRTMVADAEARQAALKAQSEQDGPAFKLRRDPRVTRVGRFLRKTSLDELPQLWNVLKGEMTLVGPRPLPVHESAECRPWQKRRLDVTPGLTCIWQVHGRSRVTFDEWMRMDLKYVVKSDSPLGPVHDATLLLKTLPAVFLKRGF